MSIEHTNFPVEVLCNPLSYLSPEQLSVFTADKYLFEVSTNNALWEGHCKKRKVTPQEGSSFKQAYIGDMKRYCTYFYNLFQTENLVSEKKADVFEKKEQIDELLKDKSNELYKQLTQSLLERAPAEEIRFLIEAGALKANTEKGGLIATALEYQHPWEIVELLIENGEEITEEILKSAIHRDISPQNLQSLYEGFYNTKASEQHFFNVTFFVRTLFSKVKTNDAVMLMIIDHTAFPEEKMKTYLQMAIKHGCSAIVIQKLMEKFDIKLDLGLLDTFSSEHKPIFMNLYLEDKTFSLSEEFLERTIFLFCNMGISFELMEQVIEHVNLAGVKLSERQIDRLTQPEMDVWLQLGEESRLKLLSKIKSS